MSRHFAIARVQRIASWPAFSRRVTHCERTGTKLPTNVDPTRQSLNQQLFPDLPGFQGAIVRWHQRVAHRVTFDMAETDFRNLPVLAQCLKLAAAKPEQPAPGKNAAAVALIYSLLSPEAKQSLDQYRGPRGEQSPLKKALTRSFTAIINSEKLLFNETSFKGVKRRAETNQLLKQHSVTGDVLKLLNRLLLEDVFHRELHPFAAVRKNAVYAIEVFLGMSNDVTLTKLQKQEWKDANLQWLKARYGADNVIAGAYNGDETTPHMHAVVVPLLWNEKTQQETLNCREVIGDRSDLEELQTEYANAMVQFGLRRGEKGSKRKYIPQQRLFLHQLDVQAELDQVKTAFAEKFNQLKTCSSQEWNDRAGILNGIKETMASATKAIEKMAELAREVLLLRRDEAARAQEFKERANAENRAATAEAKAVIETQRADQATLRADQALKAKAALVRGLDLVPIAKEILALEPTVADGIYSFSEATFQLKIEGRKFSGGRNPTDKGSGAIDLVIALTGRNFKEAVEFLLTRYSIDTLVSDSANQFIAEKQQAIVALDPKPRILTLKDVPPVIWKPAPGKWPQIFQRLVNNYHADEKYLSMLNEKGHVWATANSLLAFNRTDWGATNQERLGVTLLDLSQSELTPRILIPEQGGAFCVGRLWDKTNNVVAVANPLEALSYRSIFKMGNPAGTSLPMILSLDADLPTPELFEKIRKAKKNLTIATNRYFHIDDISQKFPQLIKPDGECVDWFGGFEYAKEKTLTKNPSRAWTLRLADAIIQQQVYQK